MPITRITNSKKVYGGTIYERFVDGCFPSDPRYSVVEYSFKGRGLLRLLSLPSYLRFCWHWANQRGSVVIRNFYTALFPFSTQTKGITMIFHLDASGSPPLPWFFQTILERLFYWVQPRDQHLVVISEYWRQKLMEKGFRHVRLIYCPFENEKYSVSQDDVEAFKKQNGLGAKPIVYIGNPQKKKGTPRVYELLKDLPCELVTSGVGHSTLPARHFNLNFREYLCLLKASRVVVTMSEFQEGWCRVAHEALLMGTPVIGSGAGGMGELLRDSGQMITDWDYLRLAVQKLLDGTNPPGINQEYVRAFTVERFCRAWRELVAELNNETTGGES